MAKKKRGPTSPDIHDVIVNAQAVERALGVAQEAAAQPESAGAAKLAPVEQAAVLAQLGQALREMENASRGLDPDVLVAPANPVAARLQSMLASGGQAASALEPVAAGGRELKFATNDALGWSLSLRDWVASSQYHPQVPPVGFRSGRMPASARLALLGDWGTGMYGAVATSQYIQNDAQPYWMLLHLGDVYYSGTNDEVDQRFLQFWPKRREAIHRALNANHEMYSGGHGYFGRILPAFKQKSSYFAYQNKHWLLLGLDTAYVEHDLDNDQTAWIHYMIGKAGQRRKVVLFSHHQLFSRLSGQGEKLDAHLHLMLRSGRIAAWYWGHEHQCVVYDQHPEYKLWARCIGHGGIPYTRTAVESAPIEVQVGDACWRRLESLGPAPRCLVLDGENRYIAGKAAKYGPHGYATLTFQDDALTEQIHAPDGAVLWTHVIR